MRFVIVSGVSGAGKSLVVKYLEDMGFFCVDNLPPSLIAKFAEVCFQSNGKLDNIALVIDIRGGYLFNDLLPGLKTLEDAGLKYEILFLEASDEVLIKRFKECRRSHPLAPEGRISKGIKEERKLLQEIKSKADHIIDTTTLSPRQLKTEISNMFLEGKDFKGLIINIISFGFKYGAPIDCDLVFDVRFIPNPFYINEMKKLTGKHVLVRDFVLKNIDTITFIQKTGDLLNFLIPNYIKEGKSQLVIGIGCTGGKHRSVAIADSFYEILSEKQYSVFVEHRDIEKDNRRIKNENS